MLYITARIKKRLYYQDVLFYISGSGMNIAVYTFIQSVHICIMSCSFIQSVQKQTGRNMVENIFIIYGLLGNH